MNVKVRPTVSSSMHENAPLPSGKGMKQRPITLSPLVTFDDDDEEEEENDDDDDDDGSPFRLMKGSCGCCWFALFALLFAFALAPVALLPLSFSVDEVEDGVEVDGVD